MRLQQLRKQIDRIDRRLLPMFNRRARLALRVGRLKKQQDRRLFDPSRERAILRRLTDANRGPLSTGAVRAIYREIFRQSRRLEHSA